MKERGRGQQTSRRLLLAIALIAQSGLMEGSLRHIPPNPQGYRRTRRDLEMGATLTAAEVLVGPGRYPADLTGARRLGLVGVKEEGGVKISM